ncbi:endoplasmic reticulum aminopeptidase 1-like [Dendronephthya gigantea]|uniref:endoplasmic reticulum aminopeptidase 1-like n=1 Tax=Dendronephthya gigantea TaxID=151771 RepID=UPI00106B207B|nr:endoplasmic reticulum aminopeptidase 1-like [Dendronephthya gigantea]
MEKGKTIKYSIKFPQILLISLIAILSITHGSLLRRVSRENQDTEKKLLDTKGRPFNYKLIRIPKDVRPLHYDLYLHPNLDTLHFKGKVQILLKCFKSTSRIILHVKDLKTDNIRVLNDKDAEIKVKDVSENTERNLMILDLSEDLKKDKEYRLAMDFNAKLAENMEGFYKSEYKTKDGKKRVLATTQFEPVYARKAFPCFDEPEFKATFEIKILRDEKYSSISNMPLLRTTQQDGLYLDHYKKSVKMSTYLVAFVVSDFKFTETTTKNGVKVRVWAKEHAVKQTEFGLDVAQHVLTYYEKFFNIKYPLPKIDLIAVPDFGSGAMENWGLMTFRETLLLFDPKSGSAGDKQLVAIVVAHELAHQWFGNLVTMEWWNDLWLNEGFANYIEYVGTDDYAKDWRVLDQFAADTFQSALGADSIVNTHPISVPVDNPAQINEIFDGISYDKGSSVIRMLRNFLGDRAFRKGLENYLNKHAYQNAVADDLWEAFSKVSSLNVKAIMDSWVEQKGYPVVTMKSSRLLDDNAKTQHGIDVVQERFLIDPALDKHQRKSEIGGKKWYIPLTYITQDSDKEHLFWVNHTSRSSFPLKKSSGWIKANVGHMGLYRVNYDQDNWEMLSNQLSHNHKALSSVDRSGLLDDAFHLARAGLLPMTIPLKLTQYLNKEKEYFPWSSALGNLAYIGSMISMTETYGLYENYLVKKLKPLELFLKWEDKGTILDKYLRASVLKSLCTHGDQGCIDITQDLFTKFVDNDEELSIAPHLRATVYYTVIKHGGTTEWEFLWSKYKAETDATHKGKIMLGLTSARQPWLLQRVLDNAMKGNTIRKQDMLSAIIGVSRNPVGRLQAWEFYKANFDKIVKRVGEDSNDYGILLQRLTDHFNTKNQLEEVKEFIKKHSSLFNNTRAGKKALESIKTNIHWMKTHYVTIFNWLKQVNNEEY